MKRLDRYSSVIASFVAKRSLNKMETSLELQFAALPLKNFRIKVIQITGARDDRGVNHFEKFVLDLRKILV